MMRDDELVAEGHVTGHEMEVPRPVSFEEALEASAGYRWASGHPFPRCFVCGPDRDHADGLRIFPGPVSGRAIVAAPWVPDDTVCDDTGRVRLEVLWAALDCPSWFGLLEIERPAGHALLGQLTARVLQRPVANERCVVTGWSRGRDGRKLYGGAALFSSGGALIGSSDAIWIELRS
jgi:hypothetical protein